VNATISPLYNPKKYKNGLTPATVYYNTTNETYPRLYKFGWLLCRLWYIFIIMDNAEIKLVIRSIQYRRIPPL